MKKLCTYLTLFVLSLLCLAQPAAATDYTIYFEYPSEWGDEYKPAGFNFWAFGDEAVLHGANGATKAKEGFLEMTLVKDDIYKAEITGATANGNFCFKGKGAENDWTKEIKVEGKGLSDGHIYRWSDGTLTNEKYNEGGDTPTPPVTDGNRTFYVKVSEDVKDAWGDDCYVYTWNATTGYEWTSLDKVVTRYSEILADGVFKFTLTGQYTVGRMLLKGKPGTGGGDWKPQTGDILGADFKDGALWTIGSEADGKHAVTYSGQYAGEEVPAAKFQPGVYYIDLSDCTWCTGLYVKAGSSQMWPTLVRDNVYKFTLDSEQPTLTVGYEGGSNDYTITPSEGNNCHKVGSGFHATGSFWYSYEEIVETIGKIYIRGSFLVDPTVAWGTVDPVEMTETTPGVFSIEAPRGGQFKISTSFSDFWNAANTFVPANAADGYAVSTTRKPLKHGHQNNVNFSLDAKATIFFDANTNELYVEYGKEQNFFYFDHTGCEWGVGQLEAYYFYEDAWHMVGPSEVVDGVTSFRIEVAMNTQPTQVYFKKIGGTDEDVTPTFDFQRQATYHYYNAPHPEYYIVGTFIERNDGVTVIPSDSRTWAVSKTPMSYDAKTGVYTFEAPQFGSFYITTWKEGDAGAWWEAKYCWIPRNAEGHMMVPTKKTTDTNIVPGRMNDMDLLVDGKCEIYFVPGAEGGHIWSSEPAYAAERWVLHGQFNADATWRDAKFPFRQSYTDDTFYCTLTPGRAQGEMGVRRIDAAGGEVKGYWFGNVNATLSEANPEIELTYNPAGVNQNAKFNLSVDKTYTILLTIKRGANGAITGASLKISDSQIGGEEEEDSWDKYDYDMYLRGMMMFGRWDQGDGSATRQMEKVASQPGLFVSTIETVYDTGYTSNRENGDGTVTETQERYHFMFSKIKLGMDVEGGFWGPNGANSYQPVGGTARLSADGTPVAFTEKSVTGLNYSFSQPCRIYVDMKNQLCWVEPLQEMSEATAYFTFLDKGGDKWKNDSQAKNKYYWWNNNGDRFCQMYLRAEDGTESNHETVYFKSQELQYEAMAGDRARTSIGYSYYFEESALPTAFLEDGKVKPNVWVRIKKGNGAGEDFTINRPYLPGALYTQGPLDDVTYNHYGNVTKLGEPLVDLNIDIEKIPSRLVVTTDHPGAIMGRSTIYDYVNRFKTTVNIDSNSYPFEMEGVTKPAEGLDDNKFEAVEGATVQFSKENDATLKYGLQSLTKHGNTGKALIYGIDYVNAAKTDNLTVKVTYKSEGMEFSLSKVTTLVDALDETAELPNIRNAYGEGELDKEYPESQIYYFVCDKSWTDVVSGSYDGDHKAVDAAFYMPFRFRKEMRENRAAYIGFELLTDSRDIDYDNIPEENFNVAKGGRPLITDLRFAPEQTIWTGDYEDGEPVKKQVVHNADTWHRDAFEQNCLAIRLHHLACNNGEGKLDLTDKTVSGSIVYRMIVPVATDVEFLAGDEINPQGVKARVSAHDDAPYTGSFSTSRRDDPNFMLTREFTFDGNKNIPTGVESVGVEDADAPVEFYNLQGIRMNRESLAPGIYIRRQGNQASKVYVR